MSTMGDVSRSVRWDEAKLSEIEANKPVRQKITEPKTPFHRMTDVDAELMCVGSLSPVRSPCISKTDDETVHSVFNDMVSSDSDNSSQLPSRWTSLEADAMDEDNAGRSSSFKEQRRAHYDEFRKVRELMRKGSLDESSNDDDEKFYVDCETPSSLAVCVGDIDIANVDDLSEKSSSPVK
ncbi:protein phosphatase inhibitor 2-like isoform X2 [Helianthus annuus]|uniref:protein phosphatase inhibitor 2-like isoform X2 n=1 Tax=Helianthus annuus TaxID=4232 RepID=UPI00165304F7|nr:protein phosphatase inhibitor 2-like isoform X2 [Helianthus annuus]